LKDGLKHFFDEKEDYEIDPMTHGSRSKYLDQYFSKEMAFEAFKKATSQNKWLVTKFKKAMKAYCQLNGYIFNPKDLQNSPGRIVQKIDGRSQEAIFIRTVETPKEFKEETDVKEFENEEDIFN
jgi:hypothetical protein